MTTEKECTPLVNFNKPPVVEAWIEFNFDLSEEENIPWNESVACKFIEENFEDFTPKHSEYFARIQFDSKGKPDFSKTDQSFNRIKAFSKDGQYCIQAGRNVLIFNQINKGSWLGYDNMLNKALEVLESYSNYRSVEKLLSSQLHYRDIIPIPTKEGKIKLEDYFTIYPQTEHSFGEYSHLRLELLLPDSCKDGFTYFTLISMPGNDDTIIKFQMDWHVRPHDSYIMSFEEAKDWLDKVHSELRRRFEEALTDKTKAIFGSKG